MNTVYIDGKLVPSNSKICIEDRFSDEVKQKFDRRALTALVELLRSEVCENSMRVINVDNRDVLDGLEIRWDGLTDVDKEALNEDQLLVNEMPDSDGAFITFPERWSTYHSPVGEMIIRVEGQCNFTRNCIHKLDDPNGNWYIAEEGRSMICDVDLIFTLPWLSKRVRLQHFGKYIIQAADNSILWSAHPVQDMIDRVKKCYHEGVFDLMDHGFIEGYVGRFVGTYEKIKLLDQITDELDCGYAMAIHMLRVASEELDNAGEEICKLLLKPTIDCTSILRED